jgi:phosphate-selective porin
MATGESWPQASRGLKQAVASGESWPRASYGLERAMASGMLWHATVDSTVGAVSKESNRRLLTVQGTRG